MQIRHLIGRHSPPLSLQPTIHKHPSSFPKGSAGLVHVDKLHARPPVNSEVQTPLFNDLSCNSKRGHGGLKFMA